MVAVGCAGRPWRVLSAGVALSVAVTLLALPLPASAQDSECAPAPFTDRELIPEVHRGNVDCAWNHDIAGGLADGSYQPAGLVRRDQMAAFIVRTLRAAGLAGRFPQPSEQAFTDLDGNVHAADIGVLTAIEVT
ncbi:MAG: hypothetical protein WD250_10915, partial [Egibacteraceae bacterium]